MSKRGRPKKQEHELRNARLPAVRLTRAERIDLEAKADRAGVELSEWVRNYVCNDPLALPLTEEELAQVESMASEAELPFEEYCRQRLLSRRVALRNRPMEASLITELNRIGNNVNQIARQLNRGRDHDPDHLGHIMHQLNTTLETMDRRYGS